jgi:predicted nucleotidyltransferase
VVLKVDSPAEICLFGSVAGNRYDYSSDIDVLVVSEVDRLKSLEALAEEDLLKGFGIYVGRPRDAG